MDHKIFIRLLGKTMILMSYVQNETFNSKMELEFGIKGRVPQMALKQEDIFDKTLIKIQNFALVIAGTMNVFGQNLINSSGCYFIFYLNIFNFYFELYIRNFVLEKHDKANNCPRS